MIAQKPDFEFWFVTGSQDLYGPATLEQVAKDSQAIVEGLNKAKVLPYNIVCIFAIYTTRRI